MGSHRIFFEDGWEGRHSGIGGPGDIRVVGDEAQHALRVKRLAVGDPVELLDGRGHVASAKIVEAGRSPRDGWFLRAEVLAFRTEPRVNPRLVVRTAVPKGPRLSEMIEGLSQTGAMAWGELRTQRGVAEAGLHKLDRVHRIAEESSKQCRRPWRLDVLEPIGLEGVLRGTGTVIVADASGPPYRATGVLESTLLIGPEGGWSPDELDAARAAGVRLASFGPHTMRIELAAPVAAAIVLHAETAARL